jgi:hypothetical protein
LYLGVLDDLKHARGRDKFIFRPHQIDVKFFGFFGASKQNSQFSNSEFLHGNSKI